ncbi:MAG: CotH kinase family protein [Prevotellaceae bacterium]|nr:CotH kinase family protein [Prevotellaceae bacterium]
MKAFLSIVFSLLGYAVALAQSIGDFQSVVEVRHLEQHADYSQSDNVYMPEPQFAYVNLTGFSSMPTNKRNTVKGWMEMYDGGGRYFKKRVTLSGQGGSSLKYAKKNFVCHFCDENWKEENTPNFYIGNWVKQDAFHFKAFYTDYFRGIGEIGYKVFDMIVADREPYWERGGYSSESDARCFPDGFPCAVYLNGKFYGVFAWQLKKHRKNMNQEKELAEHIHLDGNLSDDNIFKGRIAWTQFEVRTPQTLYANDGQRYDGNTPKELIDENSSFYNNSSDSQEIKNTKELTNKVKKYISQMSNYGGEIEQKEKAGMNEAMLKMEIERRWDIGSLVDYYVFFYLSANGDGSLKNWQWFTYNGTKWFVTPYDLDQTFGINLYGVIRPAAHKFSDLTTGPFHWIHKYYQMEIRERYKELREIKGIDAEGIIDIINDWYDRVGDEYYTMEMTKWADSPCYSDAICNAGWEVCEEWERYGEFEEYSPTTRYCAGDICKLEGRLWKATANVINVKPYKRNSNLDSIDRLRGWVAERIEYLDDYFGYSPNANTVADVEQSATRTLIGIYTMSGMKVNAPVKGVNIYKYSDGTTKKVLVDN